MCSKVVILDTTCRGDQVAERLNETGKYVSECFGTMADALAFLNKDPRTAIFVCHLSSCVDNPDFRIRKDVETTFRQMTPLPTYRIAVSGGEGEQAGEAKVQEHGQSVLCFQIKKDWDDFEPISRKAVVGLETSIDEIDLLPITKEKAIFVSLGRAVTNPRSSSDICTQLCQKADHVTQVLDQLEGLERDKAARLRKALEAGQNVLEMSIKEKEIDPNERAEAHDLLNEALGILGQPASALLQDEYRSGRFL